MTKALIAYYSQTGNTKKIAETIYESLDCAKDIHPIEEAPNPEDYDLIFVGFPVQSHSVPYKVELFIKKISPGKKIALFSTHGALSGSQLSRQALEHATVLASKAKVISTFSCRGKVSAKALEVLSKSLEHEAWADMALSADTHPNDQDVEDARAFARWTTTLSRQQGS